MNNKEKIKHNEHNKRYFSTEEMEELLKERGLKIDKKNIFKKYNYAYLIYEFSWPFYEKDKKLKYKKDSKLSDILAFHKFSLDFSCLLFKIIYKVEHIFKKHIASSLSEKFAYSYLDKKNYEKNYEKIEKFLDDMKKIHSFNLKNKEYFLESKLAYGKIPIWIFVNYLTLGQLIHLVKYNNNININDLYNGMNSNKKIVQEDLSIIKEYRNQLTHMNPIKEKLWSKQKKYTWEKFHRALSLIYSETDKKIKIFWKKNKEKLPKKIKKEIYEKYFKSKKYN